MKRYVVSLVLGMAAQFAFAQGVSAAAQDVASAPVAVQAVIEEPLSLPPGVTTEQHPLKKAYVARAGKGALLFRPSENMPEIVNEDVLRGAVETGKAQGKTSEFLGYVPELKVLPCAQGCEGSAYEAAVKQFLKGYYGNGKHFKPRGEMTVQVRWFHVRPWLLRQLPYDEDRFGVSFVMEGKLVSLGRHSGLGMSDSVKDLAENLGSRLGAEMAFTAGMGLKPTFLRKSERGLLTDVGGALSEANNTVRTTLGSQDVRSRIEPVTDEYKALLPAVDGILPGEVSPITEMSYIHTL